MPARSARRRALATIPLCIFTTSVVTGSALGGDFAMSAVEFGDFAPDPDPTTPTWERLTDYDDLGLPGPGASHFVRADRHVTGHAAGRWGGRW